MKTAETVALEKAIRRATYKMGTFGCYWKPVREYYSEP